VGKIRTPVARIPNWVEDAASIRRDIKKMIEYYMSFDYYLTRGGAEPLSVRDVVHLASRGLFVISAGETWALDVARAHVHYAMHAILAVHFARVVNMTTDKVALNAERSLGDNRHDIDPPGYPDIGVPNTTGVAIGWTSNSRPNAEFGANMYEKPVANRFPANVFANSVYSPEEFHEIMKLIPLSSSEGYKMLRTAC
jgi:hypothetical protein